MAPAPHTARDWRKIASEDTGSMFEIAACLATAVSGFASSAACLGCYTMVATMWWTDEVPRRWAAAGIDDLRDGMLTLPAALAIRNAETARVFANPADDQLPLLAQAFQVKIPEAEAYLDRIIYDARTEARLFAPHPEGLFVLIDPTRQLSGQ